MTCWVAVDVTPYSSRAVSVTVNVPADVKVFTGTAPVPDDAGVVPQLHEYVSAGTFSSVEVRASKVQRLATQLEVNARGRRQVGGRSVDGDVAHATAPG